MSSIARLSLALILGLAAGVGNYLWMSWQENRHASFVVAQTEIKTGDTITAANLGAIKIPGKPADLQKTFIAFNQGKALLVGVRATRDYRPGDLIQHDHLKSGIPHWQALGSFKLLSVGDRVRSATGYSDGRGSNTVTIAATVDKQGNYDEKTERLLDLVAAQSDRNSKLRIVAIQLDPSPDLDDGDFEMNEGRFEDEFSAGEGRLPLGPQERGIIVPLKGVESIPEVLMRGSYVSFIVDWFGKSLSEGSEQTIRQTRVGNQ